ncbi:MAG: FecR domain-containing protein [Endomicrobia bacterium]|nr:FecR domain-containing protein [Endomicrobiia bacterium]MDW8055961.1 FecR domain-containing protein [Elusimicrobiota bacterium]
MIKKKFYLILAHLLLTSIFINICFSQPQKILEAEDKEYLLQEIEVKEGQTLSFIANYYLKDPKQWPEILKYNKLDTTDIYAPLPGMKLKVPIVIVKEKFRPAHLVYILNQVKYRKRDTVDWKDTTINMELYNDDALVTYENSRANIRFYSGEILSIDENTFITIRPELKQEEVTLHKGGVRATKAKIITESAQVSPRIDPKFPKTDFRTKIRDEDKATLVEVYEGAVDVTAQGKTVLVPKGFGTEVKPLLPPSPPKALPPTPELSIKTENIKFSLQNELVLSKTAPVVSFQLIEPKMEEKQIVPSFTPEIKQTERKVQPQETQKPKVVGNIIRKYRIQIAKEPEFKKVVYDEINEIKPDKSVSFDLSRLQLPDGKYYYKVSYIDELGFENPTPPRIFIIDATPPKLETDLQQITKTDKDVIHITGKTEPTAIVKINDVDVILDQDGKFVAATTLKLGKNKIRLLSRDPYGNETFVEHEIERVKTLTKEEVKTLEKTQQKKEKKGITVGSILAAGIASAVIILVLFFFIS